MRSSNGISRIKEGQGSNATYFPQFAGACLDRFRSRDHIYASTLSSWYEALGTLKSRMTCS